VTIVKEMKTANLGLAAFMKMKGCRLLKCEGRVFIFTFDKKADMTDDEFNGTNNLPEWEVEYMNSESREHDTILMTLRRMITNR